MTATKVCISIASSCLCRYKSIYKVHPFMCQKDLISQNSVFLSDLFWIFSAIFQQLHKTNASEIR